MAWMRHRMALSRACRDHDGTLMMSERMGFALFTETDCQHLRNGKSTMFILGSGESVEEITSDQWDFVRRNVSVGINSWALHDFVPDAYSLEEVESDAYIDVSSTLSTLLGRAEVLARRPQILMLRPHSSTPAKRIVDVPAGLKAEVRLYGRTSLYTRDPRNLTRDLERFIRAMTEGDFPYEISLDGGMSVSRLISIGAKAGFQRIVLIGVDLNSSRYFFDVNSGYWERRGATPFNPWKSRGPVHDTEETTTRNFPASVLIPVLSSALRSVSGTEVFVASQSSALSASLPVFTWTDTQ